MIYEIIFLCAFILIQGDDSFVTIPNKIRFPYGPIQGPFIGIFLAISLPLEIPDYSVFFSYNFEANYVLPQNETSFMYPPLITKRSIAQGRRIWDRKYVYDILEFKLKSHGYPAKSCLLRAICETSLLSSKHTGVLGDLLHILLTPSTSINDLDEAYGKAETYGKLRRNCHKYKKKCSVNLLDLISYKF